MTDHLINKISLNILSIIILLSTFAVFTLYIDLLEQSKPKIYKIDNYGNITEITK